ncbi:hypothetical protein AJ88_33010 [Mesorhizobium amorphae CCBAU 01583]|nr:hypothetical protein AJ88_33010 [Mesorhizobium amorphae CCBAU 01583]
MRQGRRGLDHPRREAGDSECQPGAPCTFEITITNDGTSPFSGPVRIGDAIGVEGLGRLDGVAITSIEPPFGCSPAPATLPLSCIANLTIGTGESHVHAVTVVIPDDGRLANLQDTVNGQNCVGVLSPDTRVQGGGDMLSGDQAHIQGDRGKAYACHPFTIRNEVEKECSQGFVMNDAGRCVCPPGTTFRNGQCSPGGGVITDPKPKPCVLLKGQIRTEDGRCICPRGTELENGACVKVTQGCTIPGSVPTADGSSCRCPAGTHLDRNANACVRDKQKPEQCTIRGRSMTQTAIASARGGPRCAMAPAGRSGRNRSSAPFAARSTTPTAIVSARKELRCAMVPVVRSGQSRSSARSRPGPRLQRQLRLPEGYGNPKWRLPAEEASAGAVHDPRSGA